ncbi:MAG TPA: glucoamylase family protein, partial [Gammaproteobacteria bacterium]|nr:glucoamylase family protein [Gammaproteobacteria bacterium]
MEHHKLTIDAELEKLQQESFAYFLHEANPDNGLIRDKTAQNWPASIAATGMALASYPIAVERGLMSRTKAVERTLDTLRFFWNSPQGPEPDATGYKGFYYHFLDMKTGRRAWQCELSTVDSTFLLAGMLTAAIYFDANTAKEQEVRTLAEALYSRADWQWAQNQGDTVTHGWKPESGFLPYRWQGYDEALLLYILGLGSPTHPLPQSSYTAWASTYEWKQLYGYDYVYAGSLFIHQLSHIWIDFRHIQDPFMRTKGLDYFENSRRATYIQQQYTIHNPHDFVGYNACCWGITASDGPGPSMQKINNLERQFFNYIARSVPYGPDDGTIAPWAAIASLPFAPEIVLPMIHHCIYTLKLKEGNRYGFKAT